jgi:hypothetical protein
MDFRVIILFAAAAAAGVWYAMTAWDLVAEYGNFIHGEEDLCRGPSDSDCYFRNALERKAVIRALYLAVELVIAQAAAVILSYPFKLFAAALGALLVFGVPLLGLGVMCITIVGLLGFAMDASYTIIALFTISIAFCAYVSLKVAVRVFRCDF